MLIRIRLVTLMLMRIRIQVPKMMRIRNTAFNNKYINSNLPVGSAGVEEAGRQDWGKYSLQPPCGLQAGQGTRSPSPSTLQEQLELRVRVYEYGYGYSFNEVKMT
jgi:hypothetical protein